ncbi:uncharacterized protein LOC143235381 [Tachypleus tridentatus]|uniref:uncharacterized protein LOC143235381 n=1 Tax=Tachypleus tridentatus TaxID=6853 RepID=UPI003FD186E5
MTSQTFLFIVVGFLWILVLWISMKGVVGSEIKVLDIIEGHIKENSSYPSPSPDKRRFAFATNINESFSLFQTVTETYINSTTPMETLEDKKMSTVGESSAIDGTVSLLHVTVSDVERNTTNLRDYSTISLPHLTSSSSKQNSARNISSLDYGYFTVQENHITPPSVEMEIPDKKKTKIRFYTYFLIKKQICQ